MCAAGGQAAGASADASAVNWCLVWFFHNLVSCFVILDFFLPQLSPLAGLAGRNLSLHGCVLVELLVYAAVVAILGLAAVTDLSGRNPRLPNPFPTDPPHAHGESNETARLVAGAAAS